MIVMDDSKQTWQIIINMSVYIDEIIRFRQIVK